MSGMHGTLILAGFVAWVGHACIWTSVLNNLYGRPLPKQFLRPWRYVTGLIILLFPLFACFGRRDNDPEQPGRPGSLRLVSYGYGVLCLAVGGVLLPVITIGRLSRRRPRAFVAETTRTWDLWPELGRELLGDGLLAGAARLPGNGLFRIDLTDLTLTPKGLPPEWDGLSVLLLSDPHFHGTPSRVFFDRLTEQLLTRPAADLVCLLGDYVDTDRHHDWIGPVFGRLTATHGKFAVLGNHDEHHQPDRVRAELRAAGYTVLGNNWTVATVRGVPCVVIGHEGPWFTPAPDLAAAPTGLFRLCLSHTPDNFYWAVANRVQLMLSGHVHGGAIRAPLVGSIFVPSLYGRRFDQGVFEKGETTMVVGRGLSGKEPIRFRCNPQVIWLRLVRPGRPV